jgi:hypothetical protein
VIGREEVVSDEADFVVLGSRVPSLGVADCFAHGSPAA